MQVALVTAWSALSNTAVNALRLLLILHAIALGASPFVVGVMNALYFLLPAVFSVWMGRWMDRRGYIPSLVVGGAAPIVASLLCFAYPNLLVLNLAMVVIGTAYAAFSLALNSAAALAGRPEQRIANFAWLTIGFSIGNMLGPLAGGFSIDAIGHRDSYVLLAVFNAMILAAVIWTRRMMPAARAGKASARGSVAELLKQPSLRRVIGIGIVVSVCWDACSFLVPLYGVERGLSASAIGTVMGAFGLGTLLPRLAMPALARRMSEWTLLAVTFALCGIGYLLLPFASDAGYITALSFLVGTGLGLSSPVMIALLYASSPPGRQMEVIGLRSSFANVIHVGLPLGAGALGTALGIPLVLGAIGVPVLASSLLAWNWRRRFPLKDSR